MTDPNPTANDSEETDATPRPHPGRGAGRDALITAGVSALKSLTAAELIGGIGVRELSRRAGVTSATFYHHFPTVEDYAAAVVDHVYDVDRLRIGSVVSDGVSTIVGASLPVDQSFAFHSSELHRLANDPEFRVRLGLWALGGEEIDSTYGRFLDIVDDRIAIAMAQLYRRWGRELRPPLDTTVAVAIHVALLQGAAARHIVSPDRMTVENYKRLASAMSFVQLRLIGDEHTIDDRLAEINYYPLRADQVAGKRTRRTDTTRLRVLEAAASLFGTLGFEQTTVTQIARRAGVASDTIYAHFSTKARVAVELFLEHATDHLGPDSSDTDGEALPAYLERVVTFAASRNETAPLYLAALVSNGLAALNDIVFGTTVAAIERDQRSGFVPAQIDADDLAVSVLVAAFHRCFGHPSDAPADVVRHVMGLFQLGGQRGA